MATATRPRAEPRRSVSSRPRDSRRVWIAFAAIALLAAGLRIPFMWTGVGADEGGYAFIAHEWANGAHLYRDLFVDRPQGLMVLYRGLTDIGYHAWAIRLGAVLAGTLLTLLVGALGWMLRSRATGIAAAAIFAVAGVAPRLEGFTMEGELAAAVPATAAVACAVRWRMVGRDRWLLAAGFIGAIAVLMKQSGFDGLLIAAIIAAAGAAPWRARARRVGLVAGAACVPVMASIVHGLAIGWSDYWLGVYGWRAHQDLGRGLGARISDLADQVSGIAPDLWAMALVAALGAAICIRRWRALWVAPVWFVAGFIAINGGGLYLPHYFIQLLPPLALLAGIAAAAAYARSALVAVGLTCLAIVPVAVTLAGYATDSSAQRERTIRWNLRYDVDVRIARFIRAHSTRRDEIFALPTRADIYFLANRLPPTPYLWEHTPLVRASTLVALRARLSGPARPKFVIEGQNARDVDPTGGLKRAVARNYREVWRPAGGRDTRVMLARGRAL